jgi:serine protease Do
MKSLIHLTARLSLSCLLTLLSLQARPATVAYLGLHTEPLSPGASHQLDFPGGIYLEVIHVGEGSPAEKAGVQIFDILQKMDDQILVNPEQFKQLVWLRKPGEMISLEVIRKGSPLLLSATLDKTEGKKPYSRTLGADPFGNSSFFDDPFRGNSRIRDLLEREFGQAFPGNPFRSFMPGFSHGDFPPSPSGSQSPVYQPGSDIQSFSYSTSENQKVVTDEQGTLHYTEKDGKKFLRATDPLGKLLFEGPVNTESDRQKLPAGLLPRLLEIEGK